MSRTLALFLIALVVAFLAWFALNAGTDAAEVDFGSFGNDHYEQQVASHNWHTFVEHKSAELATFYKSLAPKPRPRQARSAPAVRSTAVTVHAGGVWDALQQCECPPGWHCNTGNGYFGGLQMDMQFWRSYGGPEFAARPDLASREQQITVAERARATRGYRPWPTCARRLGLV